MYIEISVSVSYYVIVELRFSKKRLTVIIDRLANEETNKLPYTLLCNRCLLCDFYNLDMKTMQKVILKLPQIYRKYYHRT